jgi:hypothetical protein
MNYSYFNNPYITPRPPRPPEPPRNNEFDQVNELIDKLPRDRPIQLTINLASKENVSKSKHPTSTEPKYMVKLDKCLVCLEKTTVVQMESCPCYVCLGCVNKHVENNLTHNGLKCPGCNLNWNPSSDFRSSKLILSDQLIRLSKILNLETPIEELIKEKKKAIFSDVKKCTECQQTLKRSNKKEPLSSQYRCRQGHQKRCIACDEIIEGSFHRLYCRNKKELSKLKGYQPCPKCLVMVKKISGCDRIVCGYCSERFNWVSRQRELLYD